MFISVAGRLAIQGDALSAGDQHWSVESMLQGPYAVFTSATLPHHTYACHAQLGVPDDRG